MSIQEKIEHIQSLFSQIDRGVRFQQGALDGLAERYKDAAAPVHLDTEDIELQYTPDRAKLERFITFLLKQVEPMMEEREVYLSGDVYVGDPVHVFHEEFESPRDDVVLDRLIIAALIPETHDLTTGDYSLARYKAGIYQQAGLDVDHLDPETVTPADEAKLDAIIEGLEGVIDEAGRTFSDFPTAPVEAAIKGVEEARHSLLYVFNPDQQVIYYEQFDAIERENGR